MGPPKSQSNHPHLANQKRKEKESPGLEAMNVKLSDSMIEYRGNRILFIVEWKIPATNSFE